MRPFVVILAILLSSCSVSNDVAHEGWLQKRKYRPGFHLNIQKPSATAELYEQMNVGAGQKRSVEDSPAFGIAQVEDPPSAAKETVSRRTEINPQNFPFVSSEPAVGQKHARKWHIPNSPRIKTSKGPQEEEEEAKEDQNMVGRALLTLGAGIAPLIPFFLMEIVTFPIIPMFAIAFLLAFVLLYLAVLPDLKTNKHKALGVLGVINVFLPSIFYLIIMGGIIWLFASMYAF